MRILEIFSVEISTQIFLPINSLLHSTITFLSCDLSRYSLSQVIVQDLPIKARKSRDLDNAL